MKIAVTRLADKAEGDRELCREFGHECYRVSPIRSRIFDEVIDGFVSEANAGRFDCIFFTSALPAKLIAGRLDRDRLSGNVRFVAIGPKTAETVEETGFECETLNAFYSREFVPYLGQWIKDRLIGIPRADVPNPGLLDDIRNAGGIPVERRVYGLEPTGDPLDLDDADAILFTSAMSFSEAEWNRRKELIIIAIGEVTATGMRTAGVLPHVTGDGSLAGTLTTLNDYLEGLN